MNLINMRGVKRYTEEEIDSMRADRSTMSYMAIANKWGCSKSVAYKNINKKIYANKSKQSDNIKWY